MGRYFNLWIDILIQKKKIEKANNTLVQRVLLKTFAGLCRRMEDGDLLLMGQVIGDWLKNIVSVR